MNLLLVQLGPRSTIRPNSRHPLPTLDVLAVEVYDRAHGNRGSNPCHVDQNAAQALALTPARRCAKIASQVALFGVAIGIFWLGLGIGLSMNPTIGAILWAATASIAGLNVLWMSQQP